MSFIAWMKHNKLTVLFMTITIVLLLRSSISNNQIRTITNNVGPELSLPTTGGGIAFDIDQKGIITPSDREPSPNTDITDRMVIEESTISLLVKNVIDVKDKIIDYAQTAGGYMVTSNVSNPEDQPTATVVIRVQNDQLKETLAFLTSLSVKVVSEYLTGKDVTDSYVDIDKHIAILEKTKVKFESILATATEISDITNLTREITDLQNQIDSYKGRLDALTKRAALAKITIYLSTDEMALPYAPSETWRPNMIFKLAVRALVSDLRSMGSKVIWVAVYSIFWLPALLIGFFIWHFLMKPKYKK